MSIQSLLPILNAGFAGFVILLFLALALRAFPRLVSALAPLAVVVFLSPAVAHAQENCTLPPLVAAAEILPEQNALAEIRRLLDEEEEDIESKASCGGRTALHDAAESGRLEVMRLLLARGANIESRDNGGRTPLMRAGDVLESVNFLLDHGANPNAMAIQGWTPLHLIAAENNTQRCSGPVGGEVTCTPIVLSASDIQRIQYVASALVRRGANLNARNSAGKTPLDYAREFGPPEYAAFFASLMNASLSGGGGVIAQIRFEIADLQRQIDSLRASIAANCAGAQSCMEQREELDGLENQVARKTSQVAALEPPASSGGGGGGGGSSGLAIGLGAAALVGLAVYAFSPSGDAEAFSIQPLASYAYNDGVESSRYGMRLTYRQDSWRLWWLADDARLGWGGEWIGDVLRADAAAWETADAMDISAGLGMEWTAQGWSLRPSFRLRTESGGKKWTSGADLSAEWARDGWTFRPLFRAADLSDFAGARIRLHMSREF